MRTAAQIAQGGAQTRTNTLTAKFLGDQGAGDVPTRTGAGVPLELGDDRGRFGEFGVLMPGWLGIVGPRCFRQRFFTEIAVQRDKRDDVLDTFGRQARACVADMSRLATAFAARGFLGGRLGGVRRIGGGWNRGVRRIPPDLIPKLTELGLQRGHLLFQVRDASIAFPASATQGYSYRSFTDSRRGHGADSKSLVSGIRKPGGNHGCGKDAELVEVTHSVSIPIIRGARPLRQVYRLQKNRGIC